jgi:hypothetical protein
MIFLVGVGIVGAGLTMAYFSIRAAQHPSLSVRERGVGIKYGDSNPELYDAVGNRYMDTAKKWLNVTRVIALGGALLIVVVSYFI